MKPPRWMALDEVRTLHSMQLAVFGGASGLRDEGLLDSDLVRPRHIFAYDEPSPSLTRLAAAYAFGLAHNHPFVDGNKRIGLVTAFAFLRLNGIKITGSEAQTYQVFMELAAGTLREADLTRWLDDNSASHQM